MEHDTLLLIKPDATSRNRIGEIIRIIELHGFIIERLRMFRMDKELASAFYAEHKQKSFYNRLMEFMQSGKVVGAILHRNNAVEFLRDLIGDTDYRKARPGTIRFMFGETMTRNAVHASDSVERAKEEIRLIFPDYQMYSEQNT